MTLAGNSLWSLECRLKTEDDKSFRSALKKIGSFTALTRLELSDFRPAGADFAAVRKLPLQELVLVGCQNLEIHLIVPGSCTSLRKLHIEDSDRRKLKVSRQPEMMEKLAVCSRHLQSLPHLHQLSGSGVLFNFVMRGVLEKWHVAEYSTNYMTTNILDRFANESRLRVWTKP